MTATYAAQVPPFGCMALTEAMRSPGRAGGTRVPASSTTPAASIPMGCWNLAHEAGGRGRGCPPHSIDAQQHLTRAQLRLVRAAIRLRELRVIGDERVLHAGHFLGELFECAAFLGRRRVALCHGHGLLLSRRV